MSWKSAKVDAQAWIDSLDLETDLTGQTLHVNDLARDLDYEGEYRDMVLRAAARILKQRAAKVERHA